MNENSKVMLGQFLELVLNDEYGINKEAHDMLCEMMKTDRELACDLHDIVSDISETSDGRFII
jgi:hypothetical protein